MLARYQFAFTISFHIVLAAFSIGLANYLMVLEALWLWRKRQVYMDAYRFWLKIFALTVAVGTASGLVMEFEFGTNWSALASRAGGILGPLMFYEVMVTFFLEAGFIGVMLFGMNKVGPRLHFFLRVPWPLARCSVHSGYFSQLLDAHPRRLQHCQRRPIRGRGLAADHIQSLVSLPHGAHEPRCISRHGHPGGWRGRLAPPARQYPCACAGDVFNGIVDGGGSRTYPARRGGSARASIIRMASLPETVGSG
ncbi:Cytochrome bd terminal oxidase subunit I [Pseudomonas sp. NFIX10]|nr:Cytochrome bd terminal oxidase subunit I [Pseudomonas sp. NFIX10]SFF64623.1 Cytochrome bd terminal oxidase subunit I [Pseudomonas sp. NFACC06-1]